MTPSHKAPQAKAISTFRKKCLFELVTTSARVSSFQKDPGWAGSQSACLRSDDYGKAVANEDQSSHLSGLLCELPGMYAKSALSTVPETELVRKTGAPCFPLSQR